MHRHNEVIVIAPPGAAVEVKSPAGYSTVVFASVEEFERWRRTARPTLARYVRQALDAVGAASVRRAELDWLCRQQCAPSVKELSAHATSRRSFFRTWKRDLPVSPNDLLRLVRRLQVEDLLARGVPEREVAKVAGFQRVAAMRQFIRR